MHQIHQKVAETYDEFNKKRELTNKLGSARRILLSYAEGKVLEVGVGTGANLRHYPSHIEVSVMK